MPSLTLDNRLIWFAHCPKAGGTSIEQFMVANWGDRVGHLHWGWDLWWKRGGWRVADPPNSPQHLVWADAVHVLPQIPDQVFAIVRDPAARLSSEHRWQRQGRRGTQLGKALARLPFPVWLRLMLAVAAHNPHAFDNHLRPQSDFIPEGAQIFYLEDGLDPVGHWLSEITGNSADVAMAHAIPTKTKKTKLKAPEKARIAQAYSKDYARFGYAHPTNELRVGPLDWLVHWVAPAVVYLERRGLL